jgi:hypothetical protein
MSYLTLKAQKLNEYWVKTIFLMKSTIFILIKKDWFGVLIKIILNTINNSINSIRLISNTIFKSFIYSHNTNIIYFLPYNNSTKMLKFNINDTLYEEIDIGYNNFTSGFYYNNSLYLINDNMYIINESNYNILNIINIGNISNCIMTYNNLVYLIPKLNRNIYILDLKKNSIIDTIQLSNDENICSILAQDNYDKLIIYIFNRNNKTINNSIISYPYEYYNFYPIDTFTSTYSTWQLHPYINKNNLI